MARDYAAERRRRNEQARARGFSSLDAQAKARSAQRRAAEGLPARRRDYGAERRQRNERARARGYRSLDEQAARRRRGEPAREDRAARFRKRGGGEWWRVDVSPKVNRRDLAAVRSRMGRARPTERVQVTVTYSDGGTRTFSPVGGWRPDVVAHLLADDEWIADLASGASRIRYGSPMKDDVEAVSVGFFITEGNYL